MVRFFLSFHCLCIGKIPHSFWGATGAGSSHKVHLQQWQLITVCALCWLHMNHFKSGSCISMSAQHFVQPKEALGNTLGCQPGSELLL